MVQIKAVEKNDPALKAGWYMHTQVVLVTAVSPMVEDFDVTIEDLRVASRYVVCATLGQPGQGEPASG